MFPTKIIPAERGKFPARNCEIAVEAEFVEVVIRLDRDASYGQNMSCVNNLSFGRHQSLPLSGK